MECRLERRCTVWEGLRREDIWSWNTAEAPSTFHTTTLSYGYGMETFLDPCFDHAVLLFS